MPYSIDGHTPYQRFPVCYTMNVVEAWGTLNSTRSREGHKNYPCPFWTQYVLTVAHKAKITREQFPGYLNTAPSSQLGHSWEEAAEQRPRQEASA